MKGRRCFIVWFGNEVGGLSGSCIGHGRDSCGRRVHRAEFRLLEAQPWQGGRRGEVDRTGSNRAWLCAAPEASTSIGVVQALARA